MTCTVCPELVMQSWIYQQGFKTGEAQGLRKSEKRGLKKGVEQGRVLGA